MSSAEKFTKIEAFYYVRRTVILILKRVGLQAV